MATAIEIASWQASTPRVEAFSYLKATLATLDGWVTAATLPAYVATAIEPMRVTERVTTWRLVIAANSNVSRVLLVPRGVTRDPPEYIDAVTAAGVAFSLQRVNGEYFINGTGKLSSTAFCNALARALSVPA